MTTPNDPSASTTCMQIYETQPGWQAERTHEWLAAERQASANCFNRMQSKRNLLELSQQPCLPSAPSFSQQAPRSRSSCGSSSVPSDTLSTHVEKHRVHDASRGTCRAVACITASTAALLGHSPDLHSHQPHCGNGGHSMLTADRPSSCRAAATARSRTRELRETDAAR